MRSRALSPGWLTLVAAVLAATFAHAQPPNQVSIQVQGVPPGSALQLVVHGANGSKTLDGGSGSLASDFMSEGKPATIYIDTCKGRTYVNVVEDVATLLPPPDEPDCDRRIITGWRWSPGARLVIDAGRGAIVPDPVGTASTIGTRADVQAAARAVLDGLRSESPAGVATGATTAAVVELASIPDGSLGTWMTNFGDRLTAMGRQGANDTTLAAMQHLLETVFRANAPGPGSSNAGATAGTTTPVPVPDAREFRFIVSANYVRESRQGLRGAQPSPTATSPSTSLSGRFLDPGGPIVRPGLRWQYSIGTGRAIGQWSPDGADIDAWGVPRSVDSAIFADPDWEDWIEVREPAVITRQLGLEPDSPIVRGYGPRGSRALAELAGIVSGILPNFVERGLRFHRGPQTSPRGSVPLSGARVQQTDQGQVSVATPAGNGEIGGAARPPQLLLAARSFVETIRQMIVPRRPAAFMGPGARLVVGPRGRREYWIEPRPSVTAQGQGQAAAEIPRPSLKVFIRSLGRSTGGDAQQAIVINDGNVPVRVLEGEAFATEPLEGVSEQSLAKELEQYAGRPRMTMNLTSYCLNFRKAPPTKGRVYRVAAIAAQDQLGPVRRVLQAAERLRDAGELHPDGDPDLYYHSVRQWAIWTVEQGFTERTFAEALLEHTKKNVVAGGRRWTREIESAARSIIPNRWRDVQQVLAEARH